MNKNKTKSKENGVISIVNQNDFQLVESYKALRTNIMFSMPAMDLSGARKILVTSAGPGEGKSTTSVNLSISLAEAGQRVLLMDADLRKPTVHRYFGLDSRKGLSNLISGMSKREECLHTVSEVPGLTVLPSGVLSPNPSELLCSTAMEKLLADFSQNYDYVLIDMPPVNVVADALSLVKQVDGVVFVASYGKTRMPDLYRAVDALRFAKAHILGIVMNRMPNPKKNGYGGNYHYYGSYQSTNL